MATRGGGGWTDGFDIESFGRGPFTHTPLLRTRPYILGYNTLPPPPRGGGETKTSLCTYNRTPISGPFDKFHFSPEGHFSDVLAVAGQGPKSSPSLPPPPPPQSSTPQASRTRRGTRGHRGPAADVMVLGTTHPQTRTPPRRCRRRDWASPGPPAAVRQAVRGVCHSGWGRLLSVTNAVEAGTWRQGGSGWAIGWAPWRGGRPPPPPPGLCLKGRGPIGPFQSGWRAVAGDVKAVGGGRLLAVGNAFPVESGPECWGGGG